MPHYQDVSLMRRALKLAQKGRGKVTPNPRVGAVIVAKDGTILGEGYHHEFGDNHAEVQALSACGEKDTRGSTLFVSLEPCCHDGKTPPCTTAIIKAGISKVVAATVDPDPKVNGRGFEMLRRAGIEVVVGVLEDDAKYLNRGYFSHRIRNRAWCAIKVALSLDGKMANSEGMSKWITCADARRLAHALRADHDGILVGGGTVNHDNPELTVRLVKGPDPTRIILSPHFGIPHGSNLARTAVDVPTILITDNNSNPQGMDIVGVKTLRMPLNKKGLIDPALILKELPKHNVLSLLIEGGSGVLSSFMEAELVDELWVGIAPTVIGQGISPFETFIPDSWEWKPRYVIGPVKRIGTDIVITYRREGDPFSLD